VYCDIDKHGYPAAWRASRDRIRPGGLWICDNTLWSGRVTEGFAEEDPRPQWTAAIKEMNEAIASDPDYLSTILPIRDGDTVALRLR
jgi:caffeoyl-CoA O-methyltransferase